MRARPYYCKNICLPIAWRVGVGDWLASTLLRRAHLHSSDGALARLALHDPRAKRSVGVYYTLHNSILALSRANSWSRERYR